MIHLKLFEAFGIDIDLENQVDSYFDEIQKDKSSSKFRFLYKNSESNTFFTLHIISNLDSEGKFIDNGGDYQISIKNRDDISTLLHEVKHLDFRIRNKNLYKTVYFKAKTILSNYSETPKALFDVFYLYDENEFQSKYHGYYKEFRQYCEDKLDQESSIEQVKYLWMKYLLSCDDKSWTYYLVDVDFKFDNFISDRKLDQCLYQMIEAGITQKSDLFKWSKNWIMNHINLIWQSFRKKIGYYSEEERNEIDKLKKYFQNLFQSRHTKYRKKFSRMILLVAAQHKIKY